MPVFGVDLLPGPAGRKAGKVPSQGHGPWRGRREQGMNVSVDRRGLHPVVLGQLRLVQGAGDPRPGLWVQGPGAWKVYTGEGVVDGQVLVLSKACRVIDAV